jgi:HSP20 family protein
MGEQATGVQRIQEPKGSPKVVKSETLVERTNFIFNDIARRAYQIFEGNGCQHGHDLEDWFKAERELLRPVNIEIKETDKALEIKADVRDFNEKELQIGVEPMQLTITGKRETTKEEKKGETVYSETMASDILRVVALPAEVDAAKVTATMKDGMLNIVAPKAAKVQTIGAQPKVA